MQLRIAISGAIRCLYGEAIDLRTLGQLEIRRGSHVEPNADGQWHVDLRPVGGPVLTGFDSRSQALAAEESWLLAHWLCR
jgi:hypothetical protein